MVKAASETAVDLASDAPAPHCPGLVSEMATLDGVPTSLWEEVARCQAESAARLAAKAPGAAPTVSGAWPTDGADLSLAETCVLSRSGPENYTSTGAIPERSTLSLSEPASYTPNLGISERSTDAEDITRIGLDEARRRLALGASFSFAEGRYEIQGELGRGGMGVVYKALQLDLNRLVALKVMLQGAFASDNQVRRFIREAEAAGRLKHPRVVRVLDIGVHGGFPYFTMEWVDGLDLSEHYRARKLGWKESAQLVASVASGVAYAHSQGIIHRDLKPENILVDKEGRTHILDFGLAKVTETPDSASGAAVRAGQGLALPGSPLAPAGGAVQDHETVADEEQPPAKDQGESQEKPGSLTRSGTLVGTPHYMSPEQARGRAHDVDVRSDVYSLGVILYELTTRRLPFDGESVHEVLYAIMKHEPRAPSSIVSDIPKELEAIVLKAMEKQRERRYQNAQELEADLIRFCRGEPVTARPSGSVQRVRRYARQHSVATAMLLTAMAVAMVLGALSAGKRRMRIHDVHGQLRAEIQTGMDLTRDLEARKANLQSARQSFGLLVDLAPAQQETRAFTEDLVRLKTGIEAAEKASDAAALSQRGEARLAEANGHLQAGARALQSALLDLSLDFPADGAAARHLAGWQAYLSSLMGAESLQVLARPHSRHDLVDEVFPAELLSSQEHRSLLTDKLGEVLKRLDIGLSLVPGSRVLRSLRIDAALLLARVVLEDGQHGFAEFILAPLEQLAGDQDVCHRAVILALREEVECDRAGYELGRNAPWRSGWSQGDAICVH